MLEMEKDQFTDSKNGEVEEAFDEDQEAPPVQYDISSYGADYDVEGLVKRLNRKDILIPPFQRNYVWSINDASRFVESLLLGLPVPAVFLAKEESKKLLVIDGQQRLRSIQFFYNGYFNPHDDDKKQQVFRLAKVQKKFEGKTYQDLDDQDKIKLNDSLIHAIIVKQESPEEDNTSIHHIFDRLNSKGRKLTPQEIRTAVDHGSFINLIKQLNEHPNWRKIYGAKSKRLKDQELILRFLAFYFWGEKYEKPMEEFLNKFSRRHRNAGEDFLQKAQKLFVNTIDAISKNIGEKVFRPVAAINAAVFDSVMVGVARRIKSDPNGDYSDLKPAYEELLKDTEYLVRVSQSTADENNVALRMALAAKKFSGGTDEEQRN